MKKTKKSFPLIISLVNINKSINSYRKQSINFFYMNIRDFFAFTTDTSKGKGHLLCTVVYGDSNATSSTRDKDSRNSCLRTKCF